MLGLPVAYPGEDTAAFEQDLRRFMPGWMAFDMRLMSERFSVGGVVPERGDAHRLTTLRGRPMLACREFAAQVAASG